VIPPDDVARREARELATNCQEEILFAQMGDQGMAYVARPDDATVIGACPARPSA